MKENHTNSSRELQRIMFSGASVEYYRDDKRNIWYVQDVKFTSENTGLAALSKLVWTLCGEQKVQFGAVQEEETRKGLDELVDFQSVKERGETIVISDSELWGKIKLTRMIQGANIKVTEVVVSPFVPGVNDDPEMSDILQGVSVDIFGITQGPAPYSVGI
jgi:hypothetical protein